MTAGDERYAQRPAHEMQAAPRVPWGRAVAVVGVIGIAHLGLFLLLTKSSITDIRVIYELHDAADLEAAVDPGGPPRDADAQRGSDWVDSRRLWEASLTLKEKRQYVGLLGYGLLGSFLIQAIVTGVLLYRSTQGRSRHGARKAAQRRG